jgi:gluconokinase
MSTVLDEVLEGFEPSPQIVSVMAASKPAVVLGLDIGTSGVRASLFDERGSEIDGASVRVRPKPSAIEDFAAIDAEALLGLVAEAIDALFEKSYQHATRVELMSISCFWHSLVGVDAEANATTPVLTWADNQAAHAAKELRKRFDEAAIHSGTGCRFHSSYWPAKLLWLRDERPKAFAATSRWLSFGEFAGLRLFGETAASVSMASGTGLFNQRTCAWDGEFMQALDIDRESFPEISAPRETFYGLSEGYASRWPQLSEARLFPAIGDGAANSIGSGCTNRDRMALMVGTSGALRVVYEGEPPEALPSELWCYRADRRRVVVGGALSDGGGLYRWLRESLLAGYDSETIENALEALAPDAHGLTVLPFWSGERSTGWSVDARGTILGLNLHTQPIEILRAAMEAVAYRFALIERVLEPLAPGTSIIASGTALLSSPVWTQIVADVLGRPITLADTNEASTLGAALLALEAAGKIQNIETPRVSVGRTFEPDLSRHARYLEGLERHQRGYERVIATET